MYISMYMYVYINHIYFCWICVVYDYTHSF